MRFLRICCAFAFVFSLAAATSVGAAAEANPSHACLVGVIVSNSAGPGFGQETAALAHAGTLDPASVAAAYCH